jgi:hypothetical protein
MQRALMPLPGIGVLLSDGRGLHTQIPTNCSDYIAAHGGLLRQIRRKFVKTKPQLNPD